MIKRKIIEIELNLSQAGTESPSRTDRKGEVSFLRGQNGMGHSRVLIAAHFTSPTSETVR